MVRLSRRLVSWRDPADGVLCSANVPRLAYGLCSSFISLRRAHHRRDRSGPVRERRTHHSVTRVEGMGCFPQRSKGGGEAGGHERREIPRGLGTHHHPNTGSAVDRRTHSSVTRVEGMGCFPQRSKGGGEAGGHERREIPRGLDTHHHPTIGSVVDRRTHRSVTRVEGMGCFPQRSKGGGEAGGHREGKYTVASTRTPAQHQSVGETMSTPQRHPCRGYGVFPAAK